ncbi:HAMP domain-containing protein [Pseudoalteromonas sp. A22]|uniref:methyl-accepting chemotaxis protein n=1 Tax=Pseudoalteromonas TaxID=53246 RepID=UPI0005F9B1A8|nr:MULTISPECIES: methyl-accepting chemotaxis protein [Pseudoalteromonas]KJZ04585.1 chemotaxis protein [Pseudoalteromonas piscicida]QUI61437.1 HAMP domain-containing protein [Pseudoalteromonas sp. A22]USE71081.1 methyl-accepting chemotaxis protein [Pseudoalteromonas flavipulchra]
MKMRKKLIISFVLTVIIPILAISVVSISQTKSDSLDKFLDASGNEIRQAEQSFVLFFEQMKKNARFLAESKAVQQVGQDTTTYFGAEKPMTPLQNGQTESNIFELYRAFGQTHEELLFVYLGTGSGGFIQYPAEPLGDYDPRKRPWYQNASKDPSKVILTEPYQGVTGQAMVSVATGIKRDGKVIGVQSLDVTLATLTDIVSNIRLGESGYLILLDAEGTVLADPKNKNHNFKHIKDLTSPLYKAIRSATNEPYLTIETDNKTYDAKIYRSDTLGWQFIAVIDEDEILASAYDMTISITIIAVIMVILFIIIAITLANKIVEPIEMVSDGLKEIAQGEGNLSKRLKVVTNDEIGELATWFNKFLDSINSLVKDIQSNASTLNDAALGSQKSINDIRNQCHTQAEDSASATTTTETVEQLAAQISESCGHTLEDVVTADDHAQRGNSTIESTVSQVARLNHSLAESANAMNQLESESQDITNILGVIRSIAEQTNLLALNAAIEAARAGEQGRGFAVVADEVRTLAQRSHDATQEIEQVLTNLIAQTRTVSAQMTSSVSESETTIKQSQSAQQAFTDIAQAVSRIKTSVSNIASQASLQGENAGHTRRLIDSVDVSVRQVGEETAALNAGADQLVSLAKDLERLVGRFDID